MTNKTIVYTSFSEKPDNNSYGIGFNYLLEPEPLSKPKKKTYKKRKKKNV